MTELDLRETLERRLGDLDIPPADPALAIGRGRRHRRRRRALIGTGGVAAFALVIGGGLWALTGDAGEGRGVDPASSIALGALDLSHGARAYADPGVEVHLGGRTFPADRLEFLDTDAVATSAGIVYYDAGRPMLLAADGRSRPLVDGPVDDPEGFHPTAKWDPVTGRVVFATVHEGVVTLGDYDLARSELHRSRDIACEATCPTVVVDAADDGTAVVRVGDETVLWRGAGLSRIGGEGVRVADLRGGVLLWSGVQPNPVEGYRNVEGPIDATLTFDGRHVLDWSSRLRATDGGPDLVLEEGPTGRKGGPGFWALDSDGSVLVARVDGDYPDFLVYDCEVPTGVCEELGPLSPKGGDPAFLGADM